ncbi:MAG: UDP-N-acetylglucosamine 1-carboxyvinyltransferase, partial [Lachnospirales bacterium]
MGEFHIVGGKVLKGKVNITGGKNAILPILASVVLSGEESVITNCPNISDTHVASEILKSIGCTVSYDNNVLIVNSKNANNYNVPEKLVSEMRSSIIFMGGVIGRFKKCKISYPGGCELGARPIDLHLKGLRALGVDIKEEMGFIICQAKELIGNKINLDFPSVGATENIMITATLAKGETIIYNCAREPEIVDLQ